MSLLLPEKYAGVILLAPAIKKGLNATGFMPGLAKVLTFILPPVRLFKESDFKMGSRYNNKEAMLADKLNYNGGQVPHTAATVIHTMDELNKVLHKVTVPYIAFQGTGGQDGGPVRTAGAGGAECEQGQDHDLPQGHVA